RRDDLLFDAGVDDPVEDPTPAASRKLAFVLQDEAEIGERLPGCMPRRQIVSDDARQHEAEWSCRGCYARPLLDEGAAKRKAHVRPLALHCRPASQPQVPRL